jgi:adenylate cyclase class IV
MIDFTYIRKQLLKVFDKCTDEDKVKDFAKEILGDRNKDHLKQIKEKNDYFNAKERDIEPKLKKWRLKDRKP